MFYKMSESTAILRDFRWV